MNGSNMDVEVGIPVFSLISSDNRVERGSFPVGRYMGVTYTGPYSNLSQVHSELEK